MHFVCATGDDPVAWFDAASNTNEFAVARTDLDEPSGELLAAQLNENIWTPRFHEYRCQRDDRHDGQVAAVENGGSALLDQELLARVLHLHLKFQSTTGGIDDARVVNVMWLEIHRVRQAGNLEREASDLPSRGDVGGRHEDVQLHGIGAHDAEQGRTLVIRRAQRGQHLGQSPGNGRSQHERIAGRHTPTDTQRLIALSESRLSGS